MPTNYTGDPTATQAPAATPNPEGAPIVALPADGDPPNASTFAQAFKVVADFTAWLFKPKAKAAQWAVPIFRFRAANGHTRGVIDHLGFFLGRVFGFDEYWLGAHTQTGASAGAVFGSADLGWRYSAVATTGAASANAVQTSALTYAFYRYVSIRAGDTAADYTMLRLEVPVYWRADAHIVWEAEVALQSATPGSISYFAGLSEGDDGKVPFTGGTPADYAVFEKPDGAANWNCKTRGGAGAETVTDSGVSAETLTPAALRIEYHGANVADNATAAVRFYINGALVATHTTNLPSTASLFSAQPHFSVYQSTGVAGTGVRFYAGANRMRMNLYPADVL